MIFGAGILHGLPPGTVVSDLTHLMLRTYNQLLSGVLALAAFFPPAFDGRQYS
jgi:hypothetical protein